MPKTDFWQATHYGFRRDSGHLLHQACRGDFDAEVDLYIEPTAKYDQAGLMVRIDSENWIKTSVEFEPGGSSHQGSVVTQLGVSDWAMRPLASYPKSQSYRIERRGSDYMVFMRLTSAEWERVRVVRLHADMGQDVLVGPYACSPTGSGCKVVVSRWEFRNGTLNQPRGDL
jgi:regulation of enolase protein 1 (concanavalin A-like superfamily)